MNLQTTQQIYRTFNGDAVVLFAQEGKREKEIGRYFSLNELNYEKGQYVHITSPEGLNVKHLIVVALEGGTIAQNDYFAALNSALVLLKQFRITNCWIEGVALSDKTLNQAIQNSVVFIKQHFYQPPKPYKEEEEDTQISDIYLFSKTKQHKAIKHGLAIAAGQDLSRELGDLPSNICTPSYLAKIAKKMAKCYGLNGLTYEVLEQKQMQVLGMHSLLSVSKGSAEPAKLIILYYQGSRIDDAPLALVGKGVTFDSGGISLKPSTAMDEMKYDMCGAAAVLGTIKAIAMLKPNINVVAVIPSVENMPSSCASKPGDIVKSLDGQTIEILNTDAEGRLILCDAITYARQQFKPKAIIDIATLTGAVIIALGRLYSGVMGNDQVLIDALKSAGEQSGDGIWQLPIAPEYDALLKSNFADIANIGNKEAGSITAACFLSRFCKDLDWAHLDIAGTAWHSGNKKGATGRPVALLVQYLLNQSISRQK